MGQHLARNEEIGGSIPLGSTIFRRDLKRGDNVKRQQEAQQIKDRLEKFLEENPALKEALESLGISYEQYRKALMGSYSYYTDTSTAPRKSTTAK